MLLQRLATSFGVLTFLAGGMAGAAANPAVPEWVEAYTSEALAAPVTLENALKYRWYQIGGAVRSAHPIVYDIDIRPMQVQLQRHGNAALSELKRQLDVRFDAVPSLEASGPYTAQCGWIMARERGEGLTQLQIDLDGYCRDRAMPALYGRLVRERAQALDVRLATLRSLDVSYPSGQIGPHGPVGREDVPATYAKALDERLTAARPQVLGDLAEHFRDQAIGEEPLRTDVAQCRALLGPWSTDGDPVRDMMLSDPLRSAGAGTEAARQFGQAIGAACSREAKAWLMRQQPEIDAAIKAAFNAQDPNRSPVLSVQARCTAVLGRWFSSFEGFDLAFTGPLSRTCRDGAATLNAQAIDIRARALAARFEPAPKTLAGLEANNWFEPTSDDLLAAHDPRDPQRDEIDRALRLRTETLVAPMRIAARDAAITEIAGRYDQADLSDADLRPAWSVCAPYLGQQASRALPVGGGDVRKAIGDACREQEGRVGVRRAENAVARAGAHDILEGGQLALTAPDGSPSFADPRTVVIAAAGNGLQVALEHTSQWLFWTRTRIRITPLDQPTPVLEGTLVPETRADGVRVWRVTQLASLPGIDGPLATMACLTQGQEAANALLGLGLAGAASIVFLDAPRTGGALIGAAVDIATDAARCTSARQGYFGAPRPSGS